MTALEIENLLKSQIPISNHLGLHHFELGTQDLTFDLSLMPNVNHKGTLFGGSLYSASALACYGLFLSGLRQHNFSTNNIVISEGQMRYLAPVDRDAKLRAFWNSTTEQGQFFEGLSAKKKARVLMRAQGLVEEKICAEFSGLFVAKT
jgi:thioesterase domain-containing protein